MTTEDSQGLAVRQDQAPAMARPMNVSAVLDTVTTIQEIQKSVMKKEVHYDTIPGTDKPTLLKPGAETLGMTFRLAPSYEVEVTHLDDGHREYEVICTLTNINNGQVWGQGLGLCSTMESKYRYRGGVKELTDKPVPKKYWNLRKTDLAKARELLGGKGFGTAKNDDGVWVIAEIGEKMENPDIADTYNTVLKMAKKRSHTDAILTALAASDIFAQDLEDLTRKGDTGPSTPPETPESGSEAASEPSETLKGKVTKAQWEEFYEHLKDEHALDKEAILEFVGTDKPSNMSKKKLAEFWELHEGRYHEEDDA